MWLRVILLPGFNGHCTFPHMKLQRNVGAVERTKRASGFEDTEEVEAFVDQKVLQLKQCYEDLGKPEEDEALVDSGKMTKEDFCSEWREYPFT
jgi:hypothetical protein